MRAPLQHQGDAEPLYCKRGIFTLLGTPHEITVPMLVHLDGKGANAKAHFVVPYVQWGLKNPSFLIWKADDDVAIDLNLTGTLSTVARGWYRREVLAVCGAKKMLGLEWRDEKACGRTKASSQARQAQSEG